VKPVFDERNDIGQCILTVRGQKVIFDSDLARIYGVQTRALNQAVKRNPNRFPPDFIFRLTEEEYRQLQLSASRQPGNRSQIVTGSQKHRDLRYMPFAFTEHGAIMAANVINSPLAVKMSVLVVRAFVRMRQMVSENGEFARRLAELEKMLTARLDSHERAIVQVLEQIMRMINPPPGPEPAKKKIGFHVKEKKAAYHL
jgi:hypothetical protein